MAALLGAVMLGCGPGEEAAAPSQGLAEAKRDPGAMFVCDVPTPPGPIDLGALVVELEVDRVYKSARPGFVREWLPAGFKDGGVFALIITQFDSVAHAQQFSDWLDHDFILDGVHFWDRPDFSLGHTCRITEIVGAVNRPSNDETQVTMREERFPVSGPNARAQLRAWFQQLQIASRSQGDTSMYMLYDEGRQEASLLSFQDVPQAQRVAFGPLPVADRPPYAAGDTFDWSGWNFTIWFPFEAGDHGKPSVWPLPGIAPFQGDGLCEVSRHESWHTTSDCLPTCGNGVRDPEETSHNCPGDVPL